MSSVLARTHCLHPETRDQAIFLLWLFSACLILRGQIYATYLVGGEQDMVPAKAMTAVRDS